MDAAVANDASPVMMNEVAYELADSNLNPNSALRYSQKAVDSEEERCSEISMATLSLNDVLQMAVLTSYWDTLGWVQFRLGHFEVAEKYLSAAWNLSQRGVIGDHLGQVYEKLGRKSEAGNVYALAIATGHAPDQTAQRLTNLLGSKALADNAALKAHDGLSRMWWTNFPKFATGDVAGNVFLFFDREDGLHDVKFISGTDNLKESVTGLIKNLKISVVFPDDHPVEVVRRAMISCAPTSPSCNLFLIPPDSVRSIN